MITRQTLAHKDKLIKQAITSGRKALSYSFITTEGLKTGLQKEYINRTLTQLEKTIRKDLQNLDKPDEPEFKHALMQSIKKIITTVKEIQELHKVNGLPNKYIWTKRGK